MNLITFTINYGYVSVGLGNPIRIALFQNPMLGQPGGNCQSIIIENITKQTPQSGYQDNADNPQNCFEYLR